MSLRTVVLKGELGEELTARLKDEGLALVPHWTDAGQVEDELGEDAWRLLLVLDPPQGDTWDREQVFRLRRRAVEVFDEIVESRGLDLPGQTVAAVTTDSDDDDPDEDQPAPGEDPGRDA